MANSEIEDRGAGPPGPVLAIRPAGRDDSAVVARIFANAFPELFLMVMGVGPSDAERVLRCLFDAGSIGLDHTLIAETAGSPAGFVALRMQNKSPSPRIFASLQTFFQAVGLRRGLRAFFGSALLGAAFGLREPPRRVAYVETLAVDSKSRRRGIGRALLSHCIALATEAEFDTISLHVLAKNSAARALYEETGFLACPERRMVPRMAALLIRNPPVLYMEKSLRR